MVGVTLGGSSRLSPWQRWVTLLVATLGLAVAAAISGTYLTALIESPLIAPTRESPTLYIVTVLALWLGCTGVAVGVAVVASHSAGIRGQARRLWCWFVLVVIVAVWIVELVGYASDPMTAIRWRHF
jgi:hypothetical protein